LTEEPRILAGPGRVHLSGGPDDPQSLVIEFNTDDRGVDVRIDNRWGDDENYTAKALISDDHFDTLVSRLLDVSETEHEPPAMTAFNLGVGYVLPLEDGALVGGAHEFVEGVPPQTLADAVLGFVDELEDEPTFEHVLQHDFSWYDEEPEAPAAFQHWFASVRSAASVAAASMLSFVIRG